MKIIIHSFIVFLILTAAGNAQKWCTEPVKALPSGITHESYTSALANSQVCYNIFLPPGYATSGKRYPVIYNLHGVSQFENDIPSLIGSKLAPLITSQEVCEFIMVFPNGVGNSWYCGIVEKTLVEELIPHIDQKYRTYGAGGRSIEGFSMGGYGAMKIGLKNPDMFTSIVSLSGAYSIGCPAEYPNDEFKGDIKQIITKYGPPALAKNIKIRLTAGKNEGKLFDEYTEMIGFLDDEDIAAEGEAITGIGHSLQDTYEKAGKKGLNFQCKSVGIQTRNFKSFGIGSASFRTNNMLEVSFSSNAAISLALFDLAGNKIEQLSVNEVFQSGSHQFKLSQPLSGGMYVVVASDNKNLSWTRFAILL